MNISVTLRNAEGETWQKEYAEIRLQKLRKYLDTPAEARVVLSVEKFRNMAEVSLTANGVNVNAREQSKDMHLAIDDVVEKIERQLKKHKEKARRPKGAGDKAQEMASPEFAGEEGGELPQAKIAETRRIELKPMSVEDALLEMETSRNRFIIFRDAAAGDVNVLYRREDGRFVLVETSR